MRGILLLLISFLVLVESQCSIRLNSTFFDVADAYVSLRGSNPSCVDFTIVIPSGLESVKSTLAPVGLHKFTMTLTSDTDGVQTLPFATGSLNIYNFTRVTVSNLYFKGNYLKARPDCGGALRIQGNGTLIVKNCRFEGLEALRYGGAICQTTGGRTIFEDPPSYFKSNSVDTDGGALWIISDLTFNTNVTFDSNQAFLGGAVRVRGKVTANKQITFISNYADNSGGALWADDSDVQLTNASFILNRSPNGGALYFKNSTVNLDDCLLSRNTAAMSTLFLNSSRCTINNSVFDSNNQGGSITARGSNIHIYNTIFNSDESTYPGAALWFDGYDYQLEKRMDPALYISSSKFMGSHSASYGGAINIRSTNPRDSFIIENSEMSDCKTSVSGGSVFFSAEVECNLQIRNVTFNRSLSSLGGAIAAYNLGPSSKFGLVIEGSVFQDSVADKFGGSVYLDGEYSFEVQNSYFLNSSSAVSGGAIQLQSASNNTLNMIHQIYSEDCKSEVRGGSIHFTGTFGSVDIFESQFHRSSASVEGGAISISSSSFINQFNMNRVNMTENQVLLFGSSIKVAGEVRNFSLVSSNIDSGNSEYGSIYYDSVGEMNIIDCLFFNNSAKNQAGVFYQKSSEGRSPQLPNLLIQSTIMRQNSARDGSTIWAGELQDTMIIDTLFEENKASSGSSIFIQGETLQLRGSTFRRNVASGDGGGLSFLGEDALIASSTFENNKAGFGGGIHLTSSEQKKRQSNVFRVSDSSFTANEATQDGGAIYSKSNILELSQNQFKDNQSGSKGKSLSSQSGVVKFSSNNFNGDSVYLSPQSSAVVESGNSPSVACDDGSQLKTNGGQIQCIKGDNTVFLSLGNGAIAGIVIAIVVFVAGVVAVIVFLLLRLKRQRIKRNRNRFSMIDFSNINLGEAKDSLLNFNEFHNMKEIGSGAFGVVFRAEWRELNVAVKQIKSDDVTAEQLTEFLREVSILKGLRAHPNVVLFIGITFPPSPLSLVTEFCEMGGLYDYLRTNQVTDDEKLQFILQISKGMLHLHLERVIHRDLAVRNILLSKFKECKVSDFGLSRESQQVDSGAVTSSEIGPIKWMPPEAITHRQYSAKSDVWSFGVVIWEIVTVQDPFSEMSNIETALAVTTRNARLKIPENANPVLSKIMQECWKHNPEERPDFAQICSLLDPLSTSYKYDQFPEGRGSKLRTQESATNYTHLNAKDVNVGRWA